MADDFGSIKKIIDRVPEMLQSVERLTSAEVLVGVPAEKAGRRSGAGGMNNATLAYIHENGSPGRNIPARPFIRPGIRKVRAQVVAMMRQGAKDAVQGKSVDSTRILDRVGMIARNSVVEAITDPSPPFQPLKPATIRARLRKTGAGRRQLKTIQARAQASGKSTGAALLDYANTGAVKPLIDTGQLRASITYVVR